MCISDLHFIIIVKYQCDYLTVSTVSVNENISIYGHNNIFFYTIRHLSRTSKLFKSIARVKSESQLSRVLSYLHMMLQ